MTEFTVAAASAAAVLFGSFGVGLAAEQSTGELKTVGRLPLACGCCSNWLVGVNSEY
jgi:hypothetical protein